MKTEFSNSWKASEQPRKQIKYRHNAPLHIKRKLVSANFTKDLRKKYEKRNFPLRKGDVVKVMRGEFSGKSGKVDSVNYSDYRLSVEGIFRAKKDGTKVKMYFHPSKVQIRELNLEDGKRKTALERKMGQKKTEVKEDKENKKEKLKIKKLPTEEKNAP
ncbi:50S ribosomal protein L24 [Candidatus Pacearchaeota archaeon]|nr:50S ribosomal protein L24 [Candidatus Pacearchaeota archaeon]